jgi:hypothetical protein
MATVTLTLELPDETMKKKLLKAGVSKDQLEDPGLEMLDVIVGHIEKEGAVGIDVTIAYDNFYDDPVAEDDEDADKS